MERAEWAETVDEAGFMRVLDLLDGLGMRYWVDGGWGVDVLAGAQSRTHRDVDIDFDAAYEGALLDALAEAGYEVTTDWRPCRMELQHPSLGYLDIHPLQIAEAGNARQADLEGGWYEFGADFFTAAAFGGRMVPCLSVRAQLLFHSGYAPREVDRLDIARLEAVLAAE